MPKQTKIKDYLSEAELQQRYRQSEDATERSHWQIIWLLAKDNKVAQVAQTTGYSQGWVREIARRYNADGSNALIDRRHNIAGAQPLVDKTLQAALDLVLQQSPPDGGLWTGPKVAQWLAAKLGRKIHRQRGWEWLERLGYSLQVPRPHHAQADSQAQDQFKKN